MTQLGQAMHPDKEPQTFTDGLPMCVAMCDDEHDFI